MNNSDLSQETLDFFLRAQEALAKYRMKLPDYGEYLCKRAKSDYPYKKRFRPIREIKREIQEKLKDD